MAEALQANEKAIVDELNSIQCKPVDIGGYYQPDEQKAAAAMRPCKKFNEILERI